MRTARQCYARRSASTAPTVATTTAAAAIRLLDGGEAEAVTRVFTLRRASAARSATAG